MPSSFRARERGQCRCAVDVTDREAVTSGALAARTHINESSQLHPLPAPAEAVQERALSVTGLSASALAAHPKRMFLMRKTMLLLAIALALGGYTPPTTAFAASRTIEGGHRIANHTRAVHRSGHSVNGYDYDLNGYDYEHAGSRRAYEWDPWGHWGAYYGPNPALL